jgi:DNA polymerase III epsilon subunit-like protein
MITFFDTETTGLPKDWKAPMTQLDNWPRVIQLAWLTTDLQGNDLNRQEILIKPDGWTIPTEPFWFEHGFNTATSMKEGRELAPVLQEFTVDLARSEYLVSHNMDFDHKVLGAEMIRYKVQGKRLAKICTKDASTEWCKIPFFNSGHRSSYSRMAQRYKWPKLEELHKKLFGRDFDNKHQAGGDVTALRDCFFELVRIGVIELEPEHQKIIKP